MNTNRLLVRKIVSLLLLAFPVLMLLALAMHFRSFQSFFNFHWSYPDYDAGGLFDILVAGKGHGFIMTHFLVFLCIFLFLLVLIVLGRTLYTEKPLLAFAGSTIGLMGCICLAGVLAAWLSFSGIATVDAQYYAGARAGFIELVKVKGLLHFFRTGSYLTFIGIIMLATGLALSKQFKWLPMLCMVIGALLFILFMDMDNWMFIGTLLLFAGLIPVSKRLQS